MQIEGNTFSEEKVTALVDGKRVLGTYQEILEVEGAIKAYENIEKYKFDKLNDLLMAHKYMMQDIITSNGKFRTSNVGVGSHIAPPIMQVPKLMDELFDWVKKSDEHPLIKSCVFHYEFEFIHPFADGNGRVGRLWQTIILKEFKKLFLFLPVESMIKDHQIKYYKAFQKCQESGESTYFIEFMLGIILKTLNNSIKSDQKNNQKSDQKILELINKNNKITIKELSIILDMSTSGIKKVIKKLKEENRLQRLGSLKGGNWEVLKD
ncbi:MAG: Fic family protein [uncultured Campylobacterales bacterium]|uniref:Fic family protein n=1 Tax=uncultured Campylobacterales bacterium TaxID=352960 RepID=A0A6S6SC11_9BACT|nr:MAG: Fic family protein [uncultured Campylobacterales bacterium]